MISSINISGVDYPLRYGMSVHRAFESLNIADMPIEEQVTHIIFNAHLCYAKSRQEAPVLKYYEVSDYVETSIVSNKVEDITRVIKEWTESQVTTDLIKAGQAALNGEEKKSLSPIMSEAHTES